MFEHLTFKQYKMMKKIFSLIFALFMAISVFAENVDTTTVYSIDSVSVVSFYRNTVNVGSLMNHKDLVSVNHGQEPSHIFRQMPNIYSMNDNGTEFGYGYFRIRGLDQTRINVTLDGMPWNESEDYGTYFANSPDLLSSIHTVKVERGTSSTNNGTASSGGSINLESIDLLKDTESYAYLGGGSFNTYKTSVVYNSGLFGNHNAVHVKATQQQTDGYKDYGFNNSQAFTVKYGYFFNSKHSIDFLSLNGRHRNGQGWKGNTLAELEANPRANGNTYKEDDEWFQSVNKIQYKGWFSDKILFTSSVYLQYQNGWYNIDNLPANGFDDETGVGPLGVWTLGLTHYLYGGNVAAKFYLNNFTLTTGANVYGYQRRHYMNDDVKNKYTGDVSDFYYDNTGNKNDANVFVSGTYKVGKWNFGANVQYRHVDFAYTDNYNPLWSWGTGKFDTNWNFINYGANVDFNINNSNKLYVRFATVNREPTRTDMFGGVEDIRTSGLYNPTNVVLTTNKAERSYDVEAGYVVAFDKIEANVNLYYMRFTNERALSGILGPNGLPLHGTADNSYRMGIEVSMDWNFTEGFHYALNTSLSRNKIIQGSIEKNHVLTPDFTLNNDIYYKGNNWRLGFNNHYHSSMYMDMDNEHKIPYYLTIGMYGNYRWKNIEFGARINNLGDRVNYYNAMVDNGVEYYFREACINFFADLKFYF